MMGNQRISRVNKEKFAMIASSLLIVTACALTGVYINGRDSARDRAGIVDFSALEDEDELSLVDAEDEGAQVQQSAAATADADLAALDQDLDVDPAYQETGSSSIVNSPDSGVSATGDDRKREDGEKPQEAGADTQQGAGESGAAEESGEGEQNEEPKAQETMSAGSFSFTEAEKLAWPVEGDVLLNYSMDQTTYFATLEQYKYNPALIIQGDVGAAVKAPADGAVKEVGENAEIGGYVILDMGSGYELTIGQLEGLTVGSGDTVKKEQTIGKVAEPSKYYSVEGSNIYLKLSKDGESVNPMNYLS